ncbi:MAG: DUF721 domain-containing protein [Alphaproteobacteria bacterium]|nr:DUF721 domain-containing protein [Alphaproteobacteria bacterium]
MSPEKSTSSPSRRHQPGGHRKGRSQRLNAVTSKLIGPALRARGITINRIITEWRLIAGDAADWCEPASIRFAPNKTDDGTLTINVSSGRGPEMQMMTGELMRRVNQVFGYAAVNRITISQTTLTPSAPPSGAEARRIITPEAAEKFNQSRQQIDPEVSEDLRKALDNLGKSLSGEEN